MASRTIIRRTRDGGQPGAPAVEKTRQAFAELRTNSSDTESGKDVIQSASRPAPTTPTAPTAPTTPTYTVVHRSAFNMQDHTLTRDGASARPAVRVALCKCLTAGPGDRHPSAAVRQRCASGRGHRRRSPRPCLCRSWTILSSRPTPLSGQRGLSLDQLALMAGSSLCRV